MPPLVRIGRRDLVLILLSLSIAGVFFRAGLLGDNVYYSGDSARQYLPERVALSQALARGDLPWWTSSIGLGYPLLAEGEVGALYPPNWLLYSTLPLARAYNLSIVMHYLLAGWGFYLFLRGMRLSRPAAYLGSLTLALGGFYIARLSHIAILSVAAWLPWMLLSTQRLLADEVSGPAMPNATPPLAGEQRGSRHTPGWCAPAGLALTVALQFLAGHAQVSVLSLMVVGFYAAWCAASSRRGTRRESLGGRLGVWLGAILVGTLLSAPQWLATWELARHSQRAGGLGGTFSASFSFHPLLTGTFFSPYALGNPYPDGSVEFMGYLGLLPLCLASVSIWRGSGRERWFLCALGALGLALAVGRWSPLYDWLRRAPLLNQFRAPARYLLWTSVALAGLAALGCDTLLQRPTRANRAMASVTLAIVGVGVAAVIGAVVLADDVDELIRAWRWLPPVLVVVAAAFVLGAPWHPPFVRTVLAVGITLVDLHAYGAVLDATYNAAQPREVSLAEPRSLRFLRQDELCRLYTKEEIVPDPAVQRESYYPNHALSFGLDSANVYMPLVPQRLAAYTENITPERLNRMNVGYYLVPQLLPVDAASELYDVEDPLAAIPTGRWLDVQVPGVAVVEIESYVSHAMDLVDGTRAAELIVRDVTGAESTFPLRVGLETAEWAYERDDVRAKVAHSLPAVASTWPASSGFPPREHVGHTYLACFSFAQPMAVNAIMLRLAMPQAFIRVERVRLRTADGREWLLSHLVGLGDHSIVYRSEDVLIYRNHDALPRAYTLPANRVAQRGLDLSLPECLTPSDVKEAQIDMYSDTNVSMRASVPQASYLVLADLHYPGWHAFVDGVEVPILRADGVYRSVALAPGEHRISIAYRPTFLSLAPSRTSP